MRCFPCFGADTTDEYGHEGIKKALTPTKSQSDLDDDLAERGLRSVHWRQQKPMTFHNLTTRKVQVIWLDYSGNEVLYEELGSDGHYAVDTFLSHPWIIRDCKTGRRLSMIVHAGPEKERLNAPSQLVVVGDNAPASFVSII
ncbi:hypothetical protein WJX73_006183 [Symbiochloris irregularis]|uniref:von Hippel-Lindau disease tumour suppressor beta domain-containing protein n=1 Tax=Symbiochloris irregularis TaxID=706552 RepID=A0AAW1PIJ2_9CHLO